MKFSLYRGNLHKVPDLPRRWPLFRPSMSLQVFQKALTKRQEALNSLGQNVECSSEAGLEPETTSTPFSPAASNRQDDREGGDEPTSPSSGCDTLDDGGGLVEYIETEDGGGAKATGRGKRKRDDFEGSKMEIDEATVRNEHALRNDVGLSSDMAIDDDEKCDGMDCEPEVNTMVKTSSMPDVVEKAEDFPDEELVESLCQPGHLEEAKGSNGMAAQEIDKEKELEKLEAPRTPVAVDEECVKPAERTAVRLDGCASPSFPSLCVLPLDAPKAKRKAELEEKLKQLQETKHQLVQMLKQK